MYAIQIQEADGCFEAIEKRVFNKAENELIIGGTLATLKKQLNPLPDESGFSPEQKQKIIPDATSSADHTQIFLDWT